MKSDITVQVRDRRWKTLLRPYCKTVEAACGAALKGAKSLGAPALTVVLADDAFIRRLNRDFRGHDKPTNVLSFPQYDFTSPLRGEVARRSRAGGGEQSSAITPSLSLPPQGGGDVFLGDLVLALETTEREAREQKKTFRAHTIHLLVHGTLHLLGFDHARDREAARMERLEIKVLEKLGISNPYLSPDA